MSSWLMLALAIIAVLGAYAAYLHWQLYRRNKVSMSAVDSAVSDGRVGIVAPTETGVQRVAIKRSMYLLADALLDDKLTHTEGCLRICAIAASLEDQALIRREYGVLFRVAEATAHIPILDAWQALSKADKQRFDRERQAIEAKYNDAVIEAAQRIKIQWTVYRRCQ